MECNIEKNLARCNCSYDPCAKKGRCCDCLAYHWGMRELPACLFPDDVEATYDRSLKKFIEVWKDKA